MAKKIQKGFYTTTTLYNKYYIREKLTQNTRELLAQL